MQFFTDLSNYSVISKSWHLKMKKKKPQTKQTKPYITKIYLIQHNVNFIYFFSPL